jgi:hypothetical protein
MANQFEKLDAQDEISRLAQIQSNEPQAAEIAGKHCSIERGDCAPDYWFKMALYLNPFYWQ